MTYSEWYQRWLELYKRKLAQKTRESYDRLHQLMAPVLGSMELEDVTPDDVQLALVTVEEASGSRQAQLAYALLHAALRRAVRSRLLPYNPVDAVDKPEHEGREGRAITDADWQLLRPIIDQDVAFALMAFAGLRRGEALALRRSDVDLVNDQITVTRQRLRVGGRLVFAEPKSKAGCRIVPILPELRTVLLSQPLMHPNTLYVPYAPETVNHRWRRLQIGVGVAQPYRLHDLRHTYATRLTLAGCNLRVLQYMIGHSSFELTANTYTHIGPSQAKIEVDRISAALH